jgi:hypothetical protein
MIEIIPLMLFLIKWHPDQPGEFDLQRQPVVFQTVGECELKGIELAAEQNVISDDGSRYQFACAEIPKSEEIREAFDRKIERALERDLETNR